MERLTNPTYMRAVLDRYGFTFKKKFGQNFLTNDQVLDDICDAAEITREDFVLEIGPGIGTLTQVLSERAGHVLAVELDSKLLPILDDTLAFCRNTEVLNQDILKVDLNQIAEEKNQGRPFKVVANLPYYITTPILLQLLTGHAPVESITVMVQKEVAERMQAGPGSKDYGALSLAIQYYTDPEYICTVTPDNFIPRPKVDSAVITLRIRKEPKVQARDEKLLFELIRAAFSQRRKTLLNSLSNARISDISKEDVRQALLAMGLDEGIRGEKLSLEDFARLSDLLKK
ncbi:MAG: 16S rRNA (adenine(1518)-N(6)/adenine(1519)-N(6))-dimethyltransferase RsmA [Lachnospiraceae bacterium]|nr:16S rRNA (adenine(1518)-N(6)/adenine(1519)-N(6))-dimethyltransferase RsmA [Lachnospiraceae bacterium]MDD6449301.1 16S rRNA (adenine(1518)-N(6)/adenine(1519)-N(6))-dimethyltransferase RsmA [Lachnospiraceae bacterium]MDD6451261.1 16S rRNA (adenine(1518)-N(6)/adenine(1519)-N(6))-dimethyltransferase RsmA [Lachnospiraceae bacterium]MDD6579278.1 16S rRNA (adenine(1518)-N(6)/adenine(1519)-N(6))-dimethyltransferase RsmA [Lachnospiraceae bacterium]